MTGAGIGSGALQSASWLTWCNSSTSPSTAAPCCFLFTTFLTRARSTSLRPSSDSPSLSTGALAVFSSKVAEVFGFRARVPALALAPRPLVLPRVAPLPLPRPLFSSVSAVVRDGRFFSEAKECEFLKKFLRGFLEGYRPGTTTSGKRKVSSMRECKNLPKFTILPITSGPQTRPIFSDMERKIKLVKYHRQ